jgi:hypothetical protein
MRQDAILHVHRIQNNTTIQRHFVARDRIGDDNTAKHKDAGKQGGNFAKSFRSINATNFLV